MSLIYENFTECNYDLTRQIMLNPQYECSPRGLTIKENLGVSFEIKDPRNRLPYISERNYSISYCVAEATWYFAGRNDVAWIAAYSPFWLDVTEDGLTANSSYGSRIFRKHDRIDNGSHIQYDRVLNELRNDKDSRRAVIYLTQSTDHHVAKKDIGCATQLQFFIRNGKLHQIATMRSSDLILGIPYDVSAFTFVQEMLALELGVGLGSYYHNSASLHIYERNFEVAEAVCNATIPMHVPTMPIMTSKPPVDKLIDFELECRKSSSSYELTELYKTIDDIEVDDYWKAWMEIFVAHKAKKISKTLKLSIQQAYDFEGYKFFKK